MPNIDGSHAHPESEDDNGSATRRAERKQRRTAVAAVALLLVVSSGLGLFRDLSLAALFGASSNTDAFLVAWTIPETATPLTGDAIVYLLVPVFVAELSRKGSVARVVQSTLLPLLASATALAVVAAGAAPLLVNLLAPGIADRALAISCFRVASVTVLFMAAAGYMMAVLRAHHRFIPSASTYAAYNVGIICCMFFLYRRLGVLGAAVGLAVGSMLMVAVQIPAFLDVASFRGLRMRITRPLLLAAYSFVPVGAYALGRQAQVFVERFVGSFLDPGAISHMNFASKIAQVPMLLALTTATVAFPSIAGALHNKELLRRRVDDELRRVILLVLPAIAFLECFAEPCVRLLLQRGLFDATDTAVTANVMRLYSLGLVGQVLVVVGVIVSFSGRRSWSPALAALGGLGVTVLLDVVLMGTMGVLGLAVGNAAGISVAAFLILKAVSRDVVPYNAPGLLLLLLKSAPLAIGAAGLSWLLTRELADSPLLLVFLGGVGTVVFFLAAITLAKLISVDALADSAILGRWLGSRKRR